MGGAVFLLAINLSVCGLLAAAFCAVAVYERTGMAARWFAASYVLGIGFFAVEFALPIIDGGIPMVTVGYAFLLAALAVFAIGLGRLYDVRVQVSHVVWLFAALIAFKLVSDLLPRESTTRLVMYQIPYSVMQALGAFIVLSARRNAADTVLGALLSLAALHYLAKPYIAIASGGVGAAPGEYARTTYAMISQSTGAVLAIAVALLVLVILVRRFAAEITAVSETDALSGLLNRRGFEERMATELRRARRAGMPVSLVLCDLDHFKAVNDTHGHAAGDKAIVCFAESLGTALEGRHLVGRIGGEEFAILLCGVNLASARLLAEGIRVSLAQMELPGLPPGLRVSASFGVAQMREGETTGELFARADAALYEAKEAGRDCVRVDRRVTAAAAPAALS